MKIAHNNNKKKIINHPNYGNIHQNNKQLSRKEQRKANRQMKKQRNRKFTQHKHLQNQMKRKQENSGHYQSNKKQGKNIKPAKTKFIKKEYSKNFNSQKNRHKQSNQIQKPLNIQQSEENNQRQIQNKQQQYFEKAKSKQKFSSNKFKDEQDQQIKILQAKLGIHKGKNNYSKFAKSMGLDDDLFDFLNNISKKVKNDHQPQQKIKTVEKKVKNEQKTVQKVKKEKNNTDEKKSLVLQSNKKEKLQKKKQQKQKQLKEQKQIDKKEQNQQQIKHSQFSTSNINSNTQQIQIRKSMTSLFNKLSDGNLLISFNQFMQIFNSYPKSLTIPIYCQLFVKFHIMIQKPILHVFLTGIALSVGVYQIISNRFMAPLIKKMVDKFLQLENQRKQEVQNGLNQEQIQEIGYSRIFERQKNFINIICYLYQFGSLTGQFLFTLVKHLTFKIRQKLQRQFKDQNQDNDNFEFLYIIIQKSGTKMRSNDPSVLKSLIDQLKLLIKQFKQKRSEQQYNKGNKIKFIEMELEQIRFNRQGQNKNTSIFDLKMSFLHTFLNKNVPNQYGLDGKQKQILNLDFDQVKEAKTGLTDWWNHATPGNNNNNIYLQNQEDLQEELINEENTVETRKLKQIAKSLRFSTQIRQKIFFIIAQAQDYIQATQKILQSKIKNQQDISAVILKVCIQQKTFNPYYPLICSKLANITPKFRLNIQYAVWDQLKQIDSFTIRQISNLAKFLSHVISQEMANSSLSILKFFPDITQLSDQQQLFMKIFMRQFFKRFIKHSSKAYLSKLINKLFEQNNFQIRVGFNQCLVDFIRTQKKQQQSKNNQNKEEREGSDYLQIAKFCRKLFLMQKDKREQKEQLQ